MYWRSFLGSVCLLGALVAPAAAQRDDGGETLDRILPDIRAAHPGRLSDAQPWTDAHGRTHYRIKWMTPEGRILFFDADARSRRYSSWGNDDDGAWRSREDGDNRAAPDERPRQRNNWNGGANPFGEMWNAQRDDGAHDGDVRVLGHGRWRHFERGGN